MPGVQHPRNPGIWATAGTRDTSVQRRDSNAAWLVPNFLQMCQVFAGLQALRCMWAWRRPRAGLQGAEHWGSSGPLYPEPLLRYLEKTHMFSLSQQLGNTNTEADRWAGPA